MSTILLLGGRSEIGLAVVAEVLRREGAHEVVLAARPGGDLTAARKRMLAAGATAVHQVGFDALALAEHEAVVRRVFGQHRVSHAVVAFGVLGDQELAWQDVATAQRLFQVDATAAVGVGVALAEGMRRQGAGTIIALSSVAGTRVRRANFVYGAAKQAMDSFYLNLAVALQGTGVRVLVVRPGAVTSPMIAGRPAVPFTRTPEQVARAVGRALAQGRPVVHVPAGFGPGMWLARLVPLRYWRKLSA